MAGTGWDVLRTFLLNAPEGSFDRRTQSIFTADPHGLQMSPLDVFLRVSFAGFAAILATVSVQSYARHRERRFLLLTSAFAIFLVQGIWLLIEIVTRAVSSVGSEWLALNLGVLVALYLALLR